MMYFLAPFLFCLGLTLGLCFSLLVAILLVGIASIISNLFSSSPVFPNDDTP